MQRKKHTTAKQRYKKTESTLIRLNKYISNSGICSRRKADDYIKAGFVTVDGKKITNVGIKVERSALVTFKGKEINSEKKIYILLNKPKDTVTTAKDTHGRKTVLEIFGDKIPQRIYPIGRLDRNTTGVLLLTNDGEITKKLIHPSSKIPKIYLVILDKPLTKNDLISIGSGLQLDDGFIQVDKINFLDDNDKKKIGIEIHSGRKRIIRRIFKHLDYKVVNLDRTLFAGLTKKNVQRGKYRFLTEKEVSYLHRLKGKK